MDFPSSVAVIVPTYNAEQYIEPLLDALQYQTLPHHLIIVDSESTDKTIEILLRRGINFITVTNGEFNHGSTRNLAIDTIDAQWVIFLTQDALPATNTSLADLFLTNTNREDIALIYGRQIPTVTTELFGRLARIIHYPAQSLIKDKSLIPRLGIRTCSCSNSFAAYRVKDFKAVGGFPSNIILGEDVVLAAKLILADKAIIYCAEAMVYHAHNYSVGEEFRRYFDIGVFHEQAQTILEPFTNVESEGVGYALKEMNLLLKSKKIYLIPEQLIRFFVKYVGYKIGKWYRFLPKWLKQQLSMHPKFW